MKCEVCGRTKEETEEEFGNEVEIQEHQGIDKCSKCIREYEIETSTDDSSEESMENKNWKDEIMA